MSSLTPAPLPPSFGLESKTDSKAVWTAQSGRGGGADHSSLPGPLLTGNCLNPRKIQCHHTDDDSACHLPSHDHPILSEQHQLGLVQASLAWGAGSPLFSPSPLHREKGLWGQLGEGVSPQSTWNHSPLMFLTLLPSERQTFSWPRKAPKLPLLGLFFEHILCVTSLLESRNSGGGPVSLHCSSLPYEHFSYLSSSPSSSFLSKS